MLTPAPLLPPSPPFSLLLVFLLFLLFLIFLLLCPSRFGTLVVEHGASPSLS